VQLHDATLFIIHILLTYLLTCCLCARCALSRSGAAVHTHLPSSPSTSTAAAAAGYSDPAGMARLSWLGRRSNSCSSRHWTRCPSAHRPALRWLQAMNSRLQSGSGL